MTGLRYTIAVRWGAEADPQHFGVFNTVDVLRVGVDAVAGRSTPDSHENALKTAARRHGVDYHQFRE